MNKTNYFAHKILTGALALAMAALVSQATAGSVAQNVTVLKVTGHARYSTDAGKTWNDLKKSDTLQIGSVIQTAEESTVDIRMGDEQGATVAQPISIGTTKPSAGGGGGADMSPSANVVHIFPSSVLAIDKLTVEKTGMDEVSETQLDLRAGKILGNVKKLSAASRYEVKIPNGVAGIRGTSYVVSATGDIFVLSGQVIISYVDNATQQVITKTINAGQHFNPFTSPPGSNPTDTDPNVQLSLINILDKLNQLGIPFVPPTEFNKNGTVVHISPSGE